MHLIRSHGTETTSPTVDTSSKMYEICIYEEVSAILMVKNADGTHFSDLCEERGPSTPSPAPTVVTTRGNSTGERAPSPDTEVISSRRHRTPNANTGSQAAEENETET